MRKIIIAGLICCAVATKAQNTIPWPASGYIGMGTNAPVFPLEVYANGVFDNGIKITQPGTQGPSALWLNSVPSGGRQWTLYSLGIADFPKPGNFVIADNSPGGGNAMFIYGASAASGASAGFVGINNITPGNRLEITQPPVSPPTGESGLRFTNLTSLKTPQANPGPGVLALNATGDVIYVPTSSTCCLGNPCKTPGANPLTSPWEIPLSTFQFNFTSPAATAASQVNIGFPVCTTGLGRLNVETDIHRFGGDFVNNANLAINTIGVGGNALSISNDAIGVKGNSRGAAAGFRAIGVEGTSNLASGASTNFAVWGSASNGATESTGGHFEVTTSNSPSNFGVKAIARSGNAASNRDIGGMFAAKTGAQRVIGTAGGINVNAVLNISAGISALPPNTTIGVYGYNPLPNPPALPPFLWRNWAGYFDGHVRIMGNGYVSGNTLVLSDKRLKNNIQNLENVLEKISKIKGYTYEFKTDEFKTLNLPGGKQIGFIAQELKEVFPQMVEDGPDGYNHVNYQAMIPVLLEAIKQQQSQIEQQNSTIQDQQKVNASQQKQIDELKALVLAMAGNSINISGKTTITNGQAVNLSDKNVIVLNQNVPNPFAESTMISYNIPTDFTKAQINFSTNDGKIIKTVDITTKGVGSLSVFANDLTNGFYTYTLIVDGKVIDTKKMVKD